MEPPGHLLGAVAAMGAGSIWDILAIVWAIAGCLEIVEIATRLLDRFRKRGT